MADKKIAPNQLAIEIAAELASYEQEVAEGIKAAAKETAKACVQRLKRTSPKRTGEYAKGWRSKVVYEDDEDIRIRIYNGTKPQITHLLENGHAKVNGGRVDGIPHIRPARDEAERAMEGKAKVVVKG